MLAGIGFVCVLFASPPIVARSAVDDTFYLTGSNLPDPSVFIRVDKVLDARNDVQSITVVQGACYFNGRGFASAPRWKMTVHLQGNASLKKGQFFLIAFNKKNAWRAELRQAGPNEVQHYVNCDWPHGQFYGYQATNVIATGSAPLDSAMGIQKVVRVSPGPGGARIVQVIQGPCPRELHPNEPPMTATYLPSPFGLPNVGDILVPAGSIQSYQLMNLLRPEYRQPTGKEIAHYKACDWPEAMKQP